MAQPEGTATRLPFLSSYGAAGERVNWVSALNSRSPNPPAKTKVKEKRVGSRSEDKHPGRWGKGEMAVLDNCPRCRSCPFPRVGAPVRFLARPRAGAQNLEGSREVVGELWSRASGFGRYPLGHLQIMREARAQSSPAASAEPGRAQEAAPPKPGDPGVVRAQAAQGKGECVHRKERLLQTSHLGSLAAQGRRRKAPRS